MISSYLRKDLRDFKPYHAPIKDYDVKIDANENPFEHCPEVIEKAREWLLYKDNLTRYPDTDHNSLREKLAQLYGVKKDNITCGVGSDQLIEYILKAFIEPGDKILVPNPSFSMYDLSNQLNHGVTINYELDDDFFYPIESIIELYHQYNPKVVFICTPNNPTGSTIEMDQLKKLLNTIKCPVVVDEAYAEFIQEEMISEIKQYEQLIVLRTFSKAFGLAGLRVGYAISSIEGINAINRSQAPYNLSSFSAKMAELVIEHIDYYKNAVKELQTNRDWLFEALKTIPVIEKQYPSRANFILVKVKDIKVVSYLEKEKILVRGYGAEGRLGHCIRLTVGSTEENTKLVEKLMNYTF